MNPTTDALEIECGPLADEMGLVVKNTGKGAPADLPREQLIEAFKTRGVVYFQGFDFTLADFETFTNSYCSDWLTYQGGAHERQVLNPGSDKSVYSVNFYLGQKEQLKFELPLHCDMSYIKISPIALFFYCVQPAATRGETMLCDGAAVYEQLRESTRELLLSKPIKYIRKYPEGNWQTRFGTDNMDEVREFCAKNELALSVDQSNGTLTTEYTVSATPLSHWGARRVFRNSILPVVWQEEQGKDASLVRFADGEPLPPDVVQEIKSVTARLTRLVQMAKGDFMFVDNTRVLHGRKGFDDPRRDVAIRMVRSLEF
jgi:alpha-ketoglutarate-dependent taurine dioxygenase